MPKKSVPVLDNKMESGPLNDIMYLIYYADTEENYLKIIKQGYIDVKEENLPFTKGVATQVVFKSMPFGGKYALHSGEFVKKTKEGRLLQSNQLCNFPIFIDRSILTNNQNYMILERELPVCKDYPRESHGPICDEFIYRLTNYKKKQDAIAELLKVLSTLTMSNRIVFANPVMLKGYIITEPYRIFYFLYSKLLKMNIM